MKMTITALLIRMAAMEARLPTRLDAFSSGPRRGTGDNTTTCT